MTLRRIVPALILLVLAYFLRPFLHGTAMLFIVSPVGFIFLILVVYGVYRLFKAMGGVKIESKGNNDFALKAKNKVACLPFVLYGVALVVIGIALFLQDEIRYSVASKQIDYTSRTSLPEIAPVRLVPKTVATRYAQDSFQNPQEHLGDPNIVLVDGKLQRIFPRLPDGSILYFLSHLSGFVTVDVDTLDRKVAIVDQPFATSEGVGVFDNLYYRMALKKYFVDYSPEPIYLKDDTGKWVTVVPYIEYRGFPFTVPHWGGVMVVQSDGTITDYSPEQAESISYLKGNRIYPKELVDYYTDSYAYRGGLINKWFLHKNETQTTQYSGEEKVFHLATKEGFKQVVVAEPYGRSYGIYKIFIFDATTGKREIMEFDQNTQLTGPIAAADYIKKEFPTYDWSSFSLAEPRPVIVTGELYWLLSIVPNDSAGIAATVFLNAKTNKVVKVDNEAQIHAFLENGTLIATPTTESPTSKADEIKQKIEAIEKQIQDLKALTQ